MLRTFAHTTLLAAALLAAASFGISTPYATAQKVDDNQETQDAAECPPVADANMCPTCRGGLCSRHHQLNCRPQYYGQPELFYNYYVPGTCGGVPAAMYLAPQPVPALVGHTYITYQPFMPHELLYQHHRTYYRYYNGGRGMTRACVKWTRPPFTH